MTALDIIGFVYGLLRDLSNAGKSLKDWWQIKRPASKALGNASRKSQSLNIFIKDIFVPENTSATPKLFSQEGNVIQANPNISKVIPEVEVTAIAKLLNTLGSVGKVENYNIVTMSNGSDIWNTNLIVLGAQSMKSIKFYETMQNVGYRMDENEIYRKSNSEVIKRESPPYGYGLIIKATNPCLPNNKKGTAILLGGFGVLGTEAAVEYFCKNISLLGRQFGDKDFSLIVRARIDSGYQSVQRISEYDISF